MCMFIPTDFIISTLQKVVTLGVFQEGLKKNEFKNAMVKKSTINFKFTRNDSNKSSKYKISNQYTSRRTIIGYKERKHFYNRWKIYRRCS